MRRGEGLPPPKAEKCRGGTLSEQARVYRAVVNGILTPGEGAQMIFMLKEIRCTKEAIDAAEATALANAPKPPPAPVTVNVLSVPSGTFLDEATMQRLNERADNFTRRPLIDHAATPEPPAPEAPIEDCLREHQTANARRSDCPDARPRAWPDAD